MHTSKAAQSFRFRYILGLTVIALLATASYLSMQRIVSEQRNYARVINLAGHQAGLSNRIAYFAGLMATTDDPTDFGMARSQVGRTIHRMAENHRLLRQGDPEAGIPALTNPQVSLIYEDPMVGLDLALERYLERARRVYDTPMHELSTGSVAYIFLTTYGPHVLEPMFDAAVDEYEAIGTRAILRIERLELVIWLAALTALVMEALLIFRPLEKRIQQTFAELSTERGFLQDVIDSVGDPIVVLDQARRVVRVNQAAARLGEHGGANSGGLLACRLDSGSARSCQCASGDCILQRVLGDGQPANLAQRVHDRDGDERTFDVSLSALRIGSGDVIGVICAYRDLTDHLELLDELRQSRSSFAHLAHHDALTGLPNRTLFNSRLDQAIRQTAAQGGQLAVLFIDLDGFKLINDSYDHAFGDKVLQAVAARIGGLVRESDTLARMGGDEFTLLLREIHSREAAGRVADKVLRTLRESFMVQERTLFIGASIGISLYPVHGTGVEDLVRQADAAMYQAKEDGRNLFRYFSEDLTARAYRRITLETELRNALEREAFVVHYQPQIDFGSQRVCGLEALVRWHHPDRGLLPPGDFMTVAEESGLVLDLGEWVLGQACHTARRWLETGLLPTDGMVSVNISVKQFDRHELGRTIRRVLAESRLPAANLELEITESTIMRSPQLTRQVLSELRGLGVKIAIDDFGTGYSSLSHLKMLPLTRLKIDKSFVSDIPEDANDMAISRAVISLGKSLSLNVLAEGIETPEQLRFLRDEGCDAGQGFLFSKPLPPEDVEDFLRAGAPGPSHVRRQDPENLLQCVETTKRAKRPGQLQTRIIDKPSSRPR
jgi:diguanylate cyclase (GGDEF)-like protein